MRNSQELQRGTKESELESVEAWGEKGEELLEQKLAKFEIVFAPMLEGSRDMIRTIVSLSAGAFVLSISVAQFLGSQLADPTAGWALPASWIFFAASSVIGCSTISWFGHARAMRARSMMPPYESLVGRLHKSQETNPQAELGPVAEEWANEQMGKVVDTIKRVDMLQIVTGLSFTAGVISLLTFAIANLPF